MERYSTGVETDELSEDFRTRHNEYKKQEYTDLLEYHRQVLEVIKQIDESTLRDIFNEIIQKAGGLQTKNWVPFDTISLKTANPEDDIGASFTISNGITFHMYEDSPRNEVSILWSLVHEELHAVSTAQPTISRQGDELIVSTGVERDHYDVVNQDGPKLVISERYYRLLNEGITEYLTAVILKEYLVRTGHSLASTIEAELYMADKLTLTPYAPYYDFLQTYAAFVSAVSNVDVQSVLNAVVRSYIKNGQILPMEVQSLLNGADIEVWLPIFLTMQQCDSSTLQTFVDDLVTAGQMPRNEATSFYKNMIKFLEEKRRLLNLQP